MTEPINLHKSSTTPKPRKKFSMKIAGTVFEASAQPTLGGRVTFQITRGCESMEFHLTLAQAEDFMDEILCAIEDTSLSADISAGRVPHEDFVRRKSALVETQRCRKACRKYQPRESSET